MTSQSAGPMKATPCSTKTICLFQSFPLLLCLLGLKAVLRKPRTRDAPTTWVLARFFFWVFDNFFCGSCPCITWARDSSKTTAAAVQESKAAPPRPWRSRAQSIGRSKLGIKLRCVITAWTRTGNIFLLIFTCAAQSQPFYIAQFISFLPWCRNLNTASATCREPSLRGV